MLFQRTSIFRCSVSCPVVSCTKASIKSPLLLEAYLLLSCNVGNSHFLNFSTSIAQILESANQCLALLCIFSSFQCPGSGVVSNCGLTSDMYRTSVGYCILVSCDLSFLSYLKFN